MTLTEFLLARIAEDETVARAAIEPDRPGAHWGWFWNDNDQPFTAERDDEFRVSLRTVEEFPTQNVGTLPAFPLGYVEVDEVYAMPHIARHDPARVLAEVEAKRRIVERLNYLPWVGSRAVRDVLLGDLALPYADHPDFNPEWKP